MTLLRAAPVHRTLGLFTIIAATMANLAPAAPSPALLPPTVQESPANSRELDDKDADLAKRPEPIAPAEPNHPFLIIPDPDRQPQPAVLHADGSTIMTEWQTLWRGMCGGDETRLTVNDLADIARADDESNRAQPPEQSPNQSPEKAAGGFHVNFLLAGSVPVIARPAFDDVAAYFHGLFTNSITITVRVNFMVLPPGVLGATGARYTSASWTNSRQGLVAGMDSNDVVQNYLPQGTTIPVRYNGNTNVVTNESRVFWTKANFNATIGSINGVAATMTFNTNFNWDFDPSDGVHGYSFQDVLVHEMGHVLGFSSGVDFRNHDIEAMDIFRFQRSGSGHFNPRTLADLRTVPRLVSFNKPNDDHCCSLVTVKFRMSDGYPYQASHFRTQSSQMGLMAPIIAENESAYPDFFTATDLALLDAIGYDR